MKLVATATVFNAWLLVPIYQTAIITKSLGHLNYIQNNPIFWTNSYKLLILLCYHSDAYPGKRKQKDDNKADSASSTGSVDNEGDQNIVDPTVRVQLVIITGVELLPQHGTKVQIQTQGDC